MFALAIVKLTDNVLGLSEGDDFTTNVDAEN
jgi:hypothetical protein